MNEALAIDPSMIEAYYNRALINMNLQKFEDSFTDINHAIELDRDFAESYNLRGMIYAFRAYSAAGDPDVQKDYREKAVEDFNTALENTSLDEGRTAFDIYNNRAAAYIRLQNGDDALADLEFTLGPDHDCAPVFDNDLVQLISSDIAQSICAHAAHNLATLYLEVHHSDYADAARLAQMVIDLSPQPFQKKSGYEALAVAEQRLGNNREACDAIKKAIGIYADEYLESMKNELCEE